MLIEDDRFEDEGIKALDEEELEEGSTLSIIYLKIAGPNYRVRGQKPSVKIEGQSYEKAPSFFKVKHLSFFFLQSRTSVYVDLIFLFNSQDLKYVRERNKLPRNFSNFLAINKTILVTILPRFSLIPPSLCDRIYIWSFSSNATS